MNIVLFASLVIISISQSFACECGEQLASMSDDKSKYEGKLSRFQWFTSVIGKGNVSCGAALIDDQHVATSAHCVYGLNVTSIEVQLNDKSMKNVSAVWSDSHYDDATGAYDFAILTLSSPVDSQFKPICVTLKYPTDNLFNVVLRVSPKHNSSVESYPLDFPNDESDIRESENRIFALTTDYGTEGFECNDGAYAVLNNEIHYFLGVLSRCTANFREAFFTDATKYGDEIKSRAPNACWKSFDDPI